MIIHRKRLLLLAVTLSCFLMSGSASAFCFEDAGATYDISPLLLEGIATVESSLNPTAIHWNKNGSYDYGIMQINSSWYKILGPELWTKLSEPCTNVHVGAWVLAQCIQRHGYTWEAVGCYNSGNSEKQTVYARKVFNQLERAGYGRTKAEEQ